MDKILSKIYDENTYATHNIFYENTYKCNIISIIIDYVKEIERGNLYSIRDELLKKYNNDWDEISWNQTLSEDFIREFSDSINMYNFKQNEYLTEDFKCECLKYLRH